MTPLQILAYASAIGVALIILAILGGVAYMIWHIAVQKTHERNNGEGINDWPNGAKFNDWKK